MTFARTRTVVAMCAGLVGLTAPPALAHDASDSNPTAVTSYEDRMAPNGAYDDPYNGYKVYLSSPRHASSGSKGECRDPGNEENVNGRQWNWRAANGTYIGDTYTSTAKARNLHSRGYGVIVSPNSRDDGWSRNRDASRAWGADLHIITHSNGTTGCAQYTSYLMTMYDESNDLALASELGRVLDPVIPNVWKNVSRPDLGELQTGAGRGDAYVELQFHDNPYANEFLYWETINHAWRYGYAVDEFLNYP